MATMREPRQCLPFRVDRGKTHRFDPDSGWCVYGCGNRDDGMITTREGNVIRFGPDYTPPPEPTSPLFDYETERHTT
jgi:hypothetical protein